MSDLDVAKNFIWMHQLLSTESRYFHLTLTSQEKPHIMILEEVSYPVHSEFENS